MSGWRPALRIARRSIRRNLGRSLLVAVLVGLPVAAATMVDVVARTLYSPERDATVALGIADAQASVTGWSRLESYQPAPWGSNAVGRASPTATPRPSTWRRCCRRARASPPPRAATSSACRRASAASARNSWSPTRASRCTGTRRSSRPAARRTRPDEVLISPSLADRLSAGIGSTGPARRRAAAHRHRHRRGAALHLLRAGGRAAGLARRATGRRTRRRSTWRPTGPSTWSTCRPGRPPRPCGPPSPSRAWG